MKSDRLCTGCWSSVRGPSLSSMRGGLECRSLGGLVGHGCSCQVLELMPKSLWQSFGEELECKWPKWSTTSVREGFRQIAAAFVMIMLYPQWHLRSMKEHLPAFILGWFLSFFDFIFLWDHRQFFKWAHWQSSETQGGSWQYFRCVPQYCLLQFHQIQSTQSS